MGEITSPVRSVLIVAQVENEALEPKPQPFCTQRAFPVSAND